MSWTLYANTDAPEHVKKAIGDAEKAQLDNSAFDSFDDDVQAQMDAAALAAQDLAKMLDTQDGPVIVNMSGHAKRGDGDTVSVSVSVSRAPKPKS